MIACEVTKREDTGRPCTDDGTSIATLVYPNGIRETKRCCAHHRAVIEAASAETLRAIDKRDADRRAEADARRARLSEHAERGQARSQGLPVTIPPPPSRTRKPIMPTVDESQLAPLPLPGSTMKGLRPGCRWPGCGNTGPGRPLCAATHRNRLLSMSKDGDFPASLDPETCDPVEFTRAWAARQTRLDEAKKAKRAPERLPPVAVDPPALPVKTYPLAPFLADAGEGGPKYTDAGFSEGAGVTVPDESATPAGWTPAGTVVDAGSMSEIDAVRSWAERADADARRAIADAHLVLDAAQVPSGFALDARIARLADKALAARNENDALAEALLAAGKDRDDAVAAISSARADSVELNHLRCFLRDGGDPVGLTRPTLAALADYDDRRGVGSPSDVRRPAYDVPRLLAVTQYAVTQLLDLIAEEAERECAPTSHVLRALRALTLGRVPEGA